MINRGDWTSLPGPADFLEYVEESLRDTKSMIALVGPSFDDSWLQQLRGNLERDFIWRDIECEPEHFFQSVSNRPDGKAFVDCFEMHKSGIHQHIFFVSKPNPKTWPEWSRFLVQFSETQRSIEKFERNVFLFHFDRGDLAPPNEVLVDSRSIHDHLREEDVYFQACRLADCGRTRSLEDEVKIHICAELALWDFELCIYLFGLKLPDLLTPQAALLEYAGNRSCRDRSAEDFYQPAILRKDSDPVEPVHSVLVAIEGDKDELKRRVWKGQVQVLFPLIEDQRCKLLERLRQQAPAVLREFGTCEDPVEIGPLFRAMRRARFCPKDLFQLARRLKSLRDEIAHIRVCSVGAFPRKSELLL